MSDCPRCIKEAPEWAQNVKNGGSAPICAFRTGTFETDNWNCSTVNALRDIADEADAYAYGRDRHVATIYRGGMFLVLGWYKQRGRTEYLAELDGESMRPVSLEMAEAAIVNSPRDGE